MDDPKTQKIIGLIQKSVLDETIKTILIRDLQSEGLTDFLREQIKAYCEEGLEQLDKEHQKVVDILNSKSSNPA